MNSNHFNKNAVEAAKAYSNRINAMPTYPSQVDAAADKLKKTRYDSSTLYGSGQ